MFLHKNVAAKLKPWNKVFFPNQRMILMQPRSPDPTCTELHFQVPPKMTKHEIKDVLQSVYGFVVKNIHTSINPGKVKMGLNNHLAGPGSKVALKPGAAEKRRRVEYKTPSFKKAVVTVEPPAAKPRAVPVVPGRTAATT